MCQNQQDKKTNKYRPNRGESIHREIIGLTNRGRIAGSRQSIDNASKQDGTVH